MITILRWFSQNDSLIQTSLTNGVCVCAPVTKYVSKHLKDQATDIQSNKNHIYHFTHKKCFLGSVRPYLCLSFPTQFILSLGGICIRFYFIKIHLFFKFIYFWLCWVFVAVRGLSLVVVSRGYSSLQCRGFSLRWLLLLRSTGSRCVGFSSCGSRAQ